MKDLEFPMVSIKKIFLKGGIKEMSMLLESKSKMIFRKISPKQLLAFTIEILDQLL